MRFVTYKQYLRGFECQRIRERRVGARIGFGATQCTSVQSDFKMVRESDDFEVRVAIAQRGESEARLEMLEAGNDFAVRLDLVASGKPDRERFLRHVPLVAHLGRAPRYGFAAQE